MPFYYTAFKECATHGTPGTLATHMRFLTVANQRLARMMGLYGNGRNTTVGGISLKLIRGGAAGSGGTSQTLAKGHPDFPAAETTCLDDATAITPGTSPVTVLSVGVSQAGGPGGWLAGEVDAGKAMKPNGGANGNLEIGSKSITATMTVEVNAEIRED